MKNIKEAWRLKLYKENLAVIGLWHERKKLPFSPLARAKLLKLNY